MSQRPLGDAHRRSTALGDRAWGPTRVRGLQDAGFLCLAGAALFVAVAVVAVGSGRGQHLDQQALDAVGSSSFARSRLVDVTSVVSFGSVGAVLLACLVLALARRRRAVALGAFVLVGGACVSTELLKFVVLTRPDHGLGTVNSLPSGHTTVALSLALASVLVAPALARGWVAVGGAFGATLMGTALLVARFHRPSDVVAAGAVCAVWSGIALAVVVCAQHRDPAGNRSPFPTHGWAILGAAAVGALVLAWGVRPAPGDRNLLLASVALGAVGLGCALLVAGFARAADRAVA